MRLKALASKSLDDAADGYVNPAKYLDAIQILQAGREDEAYAFALVEAEDQAGQSQQECSRPKNSGGLALFRGKRDEQAISLLWCNLASGRERQDFVALGFNGEPPAWSSRGLNSAHRKIIGAGRPHGGFQKTNGQD